MDKAETSNVVAPESIALKERRYDVIGTKLLATDYESLVDDLIKSWRSREPRTLSFCNTFMVAKRRHDPDYRAVTHVCDTNLPDGMPLVWCMNRQGAGLKDRVFGPIFMERLVRRSPAAIRHYFLGGDAECLRRLCENVKTLNPDFQLVGAHDGYFRAEEEPRILEELQAHDPDMVWVGMGTPKQDEWVSRHRKHFERAILLPVGSSFEILAGTKTLPPVFLQRLGLTWLHRMCSEPRRLGARYLKWNSLFVYYLFRNALLSRG